MSRGGHLVYGTTLDVCSFTFCVCLSLFLYSPRNPVLRHSRSVREESTHTCNNSLVLTSVGRRRWSVDVDPLRVNLANVRVGQFLVREPTVPPTTEVNLSRPYPVKGK